MPKNTIVNTIVNVEPDFGDITERIIRTIARDEGLAGQFSVALGIDEDVLNDYLDRVEFPVVGAKDKTSV